MVYFFKSRNLSRCLYQLQKQIAPTLTFKGNTTQRHLSVDMSAVIIAEPPVATNIAYARKRLMERSSRSIFKPLRKLENTTLDTNAVNETRKSKIDRTRKLKLEFSAKPILIKTMMFIRLVKTPISDMEQQRMISVTRRKVSVIATLTKGSV